MDKVVAVSESARKAFEESHDCPNGRTEVIYNGIRLARFEKRTKTGDSGDVVLGSITNLSRDKDFDTLLRGFAGILRVLPNARLVIVGDGPVRGDVEQLAAELGVAERVELTGYRSDVPELLPTFNVLVHSTHTEGLGLAILEAMAARVPVVASAVGGIPEIVRDGVTGTLFPAGDVEGLRDAVLAALNDPIRSAAMVEAAQQDVRRRFTVEQMCEEYRRLYEGLCARYSGR
jgi:glycosyltransferase involved in cell wall biosynthesis